MQDLSLGNLMQPPSEMLIGTGRRLEGKLTEVQRTAGEKQKSELKNAAQEFEAVFINYLLKAMRETIEESGLLEEGFGKSIYTEMFDQELSLSMARRNSLGISNLLYQNITKSEAEKNLKDAGPAPSLPGKKAPDKGVEREISDVQLPVQAPVSSRFGVRVDPFSHKTRMHKGIDLAAPEGTKVEVPWAGKVVSAGFEKGYGNNVLIQHSEGFQTRYGHLGSMNVKAGDVVSAQQVLGTVGDTGRSTGPHLHFEVIRMGKPVDPLGGIESQMANLNYGKTPS